MNKKELLAYNSAILDAKTVVRREWAVFYLLNSNPYVNPADSAHYIESMSTLNSLAVKLNSLKR